MNTDGSGLTNLTNHPEYDWAASWSIASFPPLQPEPESGSSAPQTEFDGSWQGETSEGENVSFVVSNGRVSPFSIKYYIGGDCDVNLTLEGEQSAITVNNNSFIWSDISVTLVGTFNSSTSASGTFQASSNITGCSGNTNITWQATKQ